MNITLISGSHRENSESQRISDYLAKRLNALSKTQNRSDLNTQSISLAQNPLPLWDEELWSKKETKWNKLWAPYSETLKKADGLIIITPEWAGMVPPGLKNFFLLCTKGELADKPALIVSVSAGMGGAYPVHELKTSSYKNSHLCYIPDHLILRNCGTLLKGDTPTDEADTYIRKRIDHSLNILICYTNAFQDIRKNGGIDRSQFPFGM